MKEKAIKMDGEERRKRKSTKWSIKWSTKCSTWWNTIKWKWESSWWYRSRVLGNQNPESSKFVGRNVKLLVVLRDWCEGRACQTALVGTIAPKTTSKSQREGRYFMWMQSMVINSFCDSSLLASVSRVRRKILLSLKFAKPWRVLLPILLF